VIYLFGLPVLLADTEANQIMTILADAANFWNKHYLEEGKGTFAGWEWRWWQMLQPNDEVLAAVNPIRLYGQPSEAGHSRQVSVTWPMRMRERRGEWLRVTDGQLWAKATDCKRR